MLGKLFVLGLLGLLIVGCVNEVDNMSNEDVKVKELIGKELHMSDDKEYIVQDITKDAPMQIEGLRFYESQHALNKDPVPVNTWVYDGKKVYWGDQFIHVLKEKGVFPKSEEDALKLGKLIVFARGDAEDEGKEPEVTKKEDYYEINITVFENPRQRNIRKTELIMKLGENFYEVLEVDKTFE